MKLIKCISLALLILASGLVLNAQPINQLPSPTLFGKLSGLILDSNKARVPGAKIIVERKGFLREVISADDGSYKIDLPEGKYKVKVELDGFYPFRKTTIRVRPNITTKLDVSLRGVRIDASHP